MTTYATEMASIGAMPGADSAGPGMGAMRGPMHDSAGPGAGMGGHGAAVRIERCGKTFDELIGVNGASAMDAARRVLELCASAPEAGHVFTAHAELEGGNLVDAFEALLEGWRALGYEIVSLGTMAAGLDRARLPRAARACRRNLRSSPSSRTISVLS